MADDGEADEAPVIRLVPSAAAPQEADDGTGAAGEPDASLELYRFPPLPLLSGTALRGVDGVLRPLADVTVVMTAVDGSKHSVALEARYGGWWPPRED